MPHTRQVTPSPTMSNAQQEIEIVHADVSRSKTRPTVTNLVAELSGILDRAQKELDELDILIQIADQLLERLQPHAPGKIRIAWWRKRRVRELTPVFVQLTVGMGGQWYLKAVAAKNVHKLVKRTKDFETNHVQVYRTVVLAKELLNRRGTLLGLTRQHMQAIQNTFSYQSKARSKIFTDLLEIYNGTSQTAQDSS